MIVLNILLPVFLVIALGALLTWRGFLNPEFLQTLNRLAYFVGLPCLIVSSVSSAHINTSASIVMSGIFITATLLTCVVAFILARLFGLSRKHMATFVHVSYRGNLAYLALPLVAYAYGGVENPLGSEAISLTVFVLMPAVLTYSISGVLILELGKSISLAGNVGKLARSVLFNPLIIASFIGLLFFILPWSVPVFAQRTLNAMGQLALPASLIIIGGQLALTPPGREILGGLGASLLKLIICPLFGYLLGKYLNLDSTQMKVLLLMLSSPTAVASYILVKNMDGDPQLASSAIVSSSVFSFLSFAFVLAVF